MPDTPELDLREPEGEPQPSLKSAPKRQKEIDALTREIEAEARETQDSPVTMALAAHVRKCWDAAKSAKREVQEQMLQSALQRKGKYPEGKVAEFAAQGAPPVFMNLTSQKCRAAEAWIREITSSVRDIFTIEPTPKPEVHPAAQQFIEEALRQEMQSNPAMSVIDNENELMEFVQREIRNDVDDEAKRAADGMKRKMMDQLAEAGWSKAIRETIPDLVTYKAGFIKGPIVRMKKRLRWEQNGESWVPKQGTALVVEYDRVSPFDMYPSPTATDIENGYLCHRHTLSRRDLAELVDVPGYDSASIRSILRNYSGTELNNWAWNEEEQKKRKAQGIEYDNFVSSPDVAIEAIEYWGEAQGRMLMDWGMTDELITDPDQEYQINAILIDNFIIKAVINPSPEGRKPYYKASYESIPGNFWGHGIPELMKDIQDICNASVRALVRNMGMCSGPQVAIDVAMLKPGTIIDQIHPLKVWVYDSTENQLPGMSHKAVEFFTPDSVVHELLAVYSSFEPEAEKVTGIPSYTYGSTDVGGAGRALADYEEIITSVGLMPIGDVKAGYTVANTYGGFSFITGVYPQGESNIFRMKFSNGKHVDCDMNHRWSVKGAYDDDFRVLTTREIIGIGLFFEDEPHWRLPTVTTPDGEVLDEAVYITGIEHVGTHTATCITVDSTDHLFLCANFIPTHNTATGLSMLMSNASRGIKLVISDIDENIIEPSLRELYIYNMLYDPDPTIKGDLSVVARGVSAILEKEQLTVRMIDLMNALANSPIYMQLVGNRGIANLLRPVIKSLGLRPDEIVPTDEEIEAREKAEELAMQQQQMQQSGMQPPGATPPAPNPQNVTPDGQRLGGVDNGLFVNQAGRRNG